MRVPLGKRGLTCFLPGTVVSLTEEMEGGIAMRLQESGEMYLEAIFVLKRTSGHVRSIDVSEYLGYSKPSVSRAVGLLKEGGYIVVEEDGGLALTDAGKEIAEKIYERHTILSALLCRLGVSEETASLVAGQMNAIRINQLEATQILRQQLQTLNTIAQNTAYNRYLARIERIITILENNSGDYLRSQGWS